MARAGVDCPQRTGPGTRDAWCRGLWSWLLSLADADVPPTVRTDPGTRLASRDREIFGTAPLISPTKQRISVSHAGSSLVSPTSKTTSLRQRDRRRSQHACEHRTRSPCQSSPSLKLRLSCRARHKPRTEKKKSPSRDCRDLLTAIAMASSSDAPLAFLRNNPVVSGLTDFYNAFQERREKLGLTNPGLVENIAKGTPQRARCAWPVPSRRSRVVRVTLTYAATEVQRDVLTTNLMFTGLRADLTKAFSLNPLYVPSQPETSHQGGMSGQARARPARRRGFACTLGSPPVIARC